MKVNVETNFQLLSKNYLVSSLSEAVAFAVAAAEAIKRGSGEHIEAVFTLDRSGFAVGVFSGIEGDLDVTRQIDEAVQLISLNNSYEDLQVVHSEQQARQIANDSHWRKLSYQASHDSFGKWKCINLEGDHEILAKIFPAADLDDSLKMASVVTDLAIKNDFAHDVMIGPDPKKMLVVLHVYGEGALPRHYHNITRQINLALEGK